MTKQKHFKKHVRDRMARTGESYTAARRQLLAALEGGEFESAGTSSSIEIPDVAGVHSATSALRILLRHAGHGVDEATLLAAGGGVGIGVFSFHYEDFSSFFLAGRHLWHDDLTFYRHLADRLGLELDVRETGSKAKAERELFDALETGPVIAFVDLGTLGYRGGVEAYYVVTVLSPDADEGTAVIADLAEAPIELPLETLAAGRARHRKFKNRLVRLASVPTDLDLPAATAAGLAACVDGFENPEMEGFHRNFTLDALDSLAARMRGTGKDSWSQVFPPGPRLMGALGSFYEYVEHYGTGGGLLRPFWADALRDADGCVAADLGAAADLYDAVGAAWSEAAQAALPENVSEFSELRTSIDETYATYYASGTEALDDLERVREARSARIRRDFPLSNADARAHLESLADRIDALAERERSALRTLAEAIGRD